MKRALRTLKHEEGIRFAQAIVRTYVAEERRLTEELIADRRREVEVEVKVAR